MSTFNKKLEGKELENYIAKRFPSQSNKKGSNNKMAQMQTVGTHKTNIVILEGLTSVVYHNTAVVQFNDKEIILNSGGWETATTKTRMNQASRQYSLGFDVYQVDFSWYVNYKGETIPFTDGMILKR